MSDFVYAYTPWTMASTYGQGNYGSCIYSPSAGTTCASNGSLVNTGSAAFIITAIAVLILVTALIVRWRRNSKK
jgi:hypothetical protein